MNRWGVSGISGLAALALLLTGCSQVDSVVDQANTVQDKAGTCAEALGLANFDPTALDPDKVRAEAKKKADRLRELGGQVADGDVKESLYTMADSYVALEKQRIDRLGDLSGWIQRHVDNVDNLRKVCL
jgi:hypothetical protein